MLVHRLPSLALWTAGKLLGLSLEQLRCHCLTARDFIQIYLNSYCPRAFAPRSWP